MQMVRSRWHRVGGVLLGAVLSSTLPASAQEFSYKAFKRDVGDSTGYGVSYRGALCIVTASVPGEEDTRSFSLADSKPFEVAKAKVIEQPTSKVFIFGGTDFPDAVPYEADFQLKAGESLVAVGPTGEQVEAALLFNPGNGDAYHSWMGPVRLMLVLEDPDLEPPVRSGWPVFSKTSGKVVGTVVPKRSVLAPHPPVTIPGQFLFEPLCLPSTEKREETMRRNYGGIELVEPQPESLFRWLLPTCLWDVEVGIGREELEEKRGKLSSFREDFDDHRYVIRDDTPALYRVQYLPGPDKESRERTVAIEMSGTINPYLGEYPKAERLVEAMEKAFGKPRLFSSSFDPPGIAKTQFIAHWLSGERGMTLRISREPLALSVHMMISETKRNKLLDRVLAEHKMGGPPASILAAYHDWLADTAAN
ncbi:hypothetical protein HAHE_06620 [Haloferula helveola]|uniref:Uncharacterized protein n=1 Tax=Haloferula helveola TaxID=490095 RepID=A0ABN6H2F4_9BACT|nr:hypothetical protein HAHE_06620 [Haloferula helveola]